MRLRCFVFLGVLGLASPASAEAPTKPSEAPAPPKEGPKEAPKEAKEAPKEAEHDAMPKIVRIAMTGVASDKLSQVRVRRLVELQLGGDLDIPAFASGPLDENSVRVFIDLPEPFIVEVQVQAQNRRIEKRRVDVAGLPWEVAARFVAIATSELVRGHLVPPRKPRPKIETERDVIDRLRKVPSFDVGSRLEAVYAQSFPTALFGSRLSFGVHTAPISQAFSVGILGSTEGFSLIDLGTMVGHRLWLTPETRLLLGGGFSLSAIPDDDVFFVRTQANLALTQAFGPHAEGIIELTPGVVISETPGFWVGGSVGILFR